MKRTKSVNMSFTPASGMYTASFTVSSNGKITMKTASAINVTIEELKTMVAAVEEEYNRVKSEANTDSNQQAQSSAQSIDWS